MKKQNFPWFAALVIGAAYLVLALAGVGCPIRAVTGVSCAGCGMTRAWGRALQGDWMGALRCHPLFWTVPLLVLAFLLRGRLSQTARRGIAGLALAAFLVVYGVRLALPGDIIVVFQPQEGLFFQGAAFALKRIGGWIHVL